MEIKVPLGRITDCNQAVRRVVRQLSRIAVSIQDERQGAARQVEEPLFSVRQDQRPSVRMYGSLVECRWNICRGSGTVGVSVPPERPKVSVAPRIFQVVI